MKLYKLLNTAEQLDYNHKKKSFNWFNFMAQDFNTLTETVYFDIQINVSP